MDTNKLKLRLIEVTLVVAILVVVASIPLKIVFRDELKQFDDVVASALGLETSFVQGVSTIVGLGLALWFGYSASNKKNRQPGRLFRLAIMTLMTIAGICFAVFGIFVFVKLIGSNDASTGKNFAGVGIVFLFALFSFICFKLFLRAKNSANNRLHEDT